ncbi:MAG: hypothetical protein FWG81_06550 [Betaproteobacteria bacterium]|nr:hypothetical protein [Betaproteobacteria bacterium]
MQRRSFIGHSREGGNPELPFRSYVVSAWERSFCLKLFWILVSASGSVLDSRLRWNDEWAEKARKMFASKPF